MVYRDTPRYKNWVSIKEGRIFYSNLCNKEIKKNTFVINKKKELIR